MLLKGNDAATAVSPSAHILTSRLRWTSIFVPIAFLLLILAVANVEYFSPRAIVPEEAHFVISGMIHILPNAALVFLIYTAFTTLSCHISVYKNAVVWQLRTKVRAVRWEDVSDYYLISSEPYAVHVIETIYGDRLVFGSPNKPCTKMKRLRNEVQMRAINAPVRQWQKLENRKMVGESVQLGRSRGQIMFCWLLALALLSVAVYVAAIIPTAVLAFVDAIDPGASINVWHVLIAAAAFLGFCLILGLYGRSLWQYSLHFRDRLELTEESITVFQPERVHRYRWQDVLSVACQNRWPAALNHRVILEFSDGWKYFAYPLPGTLELLKSQLASFYGRQIEDYKQIVILDLDTDAQRWPDGKPGEGTERFSYHSRSMRALLVLLIVVGYLVVFGRSVSTTETQYNPTYPALALAVPAVYFFWRYKKAGVLVDDEGLTQCKPFGKTSIKWEEIQTARMTKEFLIPHIYIKGKNETLRIWSGINRPDQLVQRIRDNGVTVEELD